MKQLITILGVVLGLAATAQVPQSFSYQGVARNSSGQPLVSQNIGVQFSIIKTSASGTVEYTETHNTTTNAYGLFTLNVGGGTPVSGTFAGIDWSQGPKFLKVEIDPAGGTSYTHIGTTQLLSVPYAQFAGNGDKTVTLTGQGGIQVGGTYPNFTINDSATLAITNTVPTGKFTGRVLLTNQFGKYLFDFSGVTVKLDNYTTTTSSDGVFLFTNIPEGVYDLEISKAGYNTFRAPGVLVLRGTKPSSYTSAFASSTNGITIGALPVFTVSVSAPSIDGSGILHVPTTVSPFYANSDSSRRFVIFIFRDSTVSEVSYDLASLVNSAGKTQATWDNEFAPILKTLNGTPLGHQFQSGDKIYFRAYALAAGIVGFDPVTQKALYPIVPGSGSAVVSVTLP